MPGTPDPKDTEAESLVSYLDQQTDGLKNAAFGLTEEQLRLTPTASALSVGGLLKHGAAMHRQWIQILRGPDETAGAGGEAAYGDSFRLGPDDTAASLVADLDVAAGATTEAVRGLDSLSAPVTLPPAPWFPSDRSGYTARWVLLHLLEELARHAGQADIVRESIDGATMYELMAGAEGWPATAWLTPWQPPSA